jgi:hypothetical protein
LLVVQPFYRLHSNSSERQEDERRTEIHNRQNDQLMIEFGPWLVAAADRFSAQHPPNSLAGVLFMWRFRLCNIFIGAQVQLPPFVQVCSFELID